MNNIKVKKEYRPMPFWSWNDILEYSETERQIKIMKEAGIGGFFMHARGGLKTEYLSDEWFGNVETSIDVANNNNMQPWAYDENGWPSGFGDGSVNGLGVEYQQKYLRYSCDKPEKNVLCKSRDIWFYYDVNPYYVDVLDKKVVSKFIEVGYKPYFERFGNSFEGFFTDEPHISRDGFPWSFVFEDEYKKRYNDNIYEHLEELFFQKGNYKETRIRFWKMVTELFSESYVKQIQMWCNERGLKLTGHLLLEDTLLYQMMANGACMPHYEYFDIPGMDWLGRNIEDCLTPLQVSSVAEQLGKKRVLAESFALCGHNVSFAELKGIYEWQLVHGCNFLCPHLEGYSMRGIRKRDYPPAMYYQQPWWDSYKYFTDAMALESMILAEGENKVNVLLLHPQTTVWALFNNADNEPIKSLNTKIVEDVKKLENKHVVFHLGDELILERHAKVENGILVVGKQKYDIVINSCCEELLKNTKELLRKFEAEGGKILHSVDLIEENNVIDDKEITYTKRLYEGCNVHFFVNSSSLRKKCSINVTGKAVDIYTGQLNDVGVEHEFEPWGSLMVIEDGDNVLHTKETKQNFVVPYKELKIKKPIMNSITLDKCDYYFDGVLQEKNGYILNICERANALEKPVKIHIDFYVEILEIPNTLLLASEMSDNFEISINNVVIDKKYIGYFIDKSIRQIDIKEYIVEGKNKISIDIDFRQSELVYQNIKKSKIYESEKNKLVYDMEIEPIYLNGDFSVITDGDWIELEKDAVRYYGDFKIGKKKEFIEACDIEKQGYPFFCGLMELEGIVNICGENPVLKLNPKGVNSIEVELNHIKKIMLTNNHLSLSDFNVSGEQKIKLTLRNNLRNIMGPHHLKEGESYHVGPDAFYKEKCVWNNDDGKWDEGYCFVKFGII